MTIYEAISKVMAEVGAIGKDHKNDQQNFNFRSVEDVYNRVQPLFVRHGVFSVPNVVNSERHEGRTKAGGVMHYSILTVEYEFFANDGTSVKATVVGEGLDSGDKASNKAMAAAHKYAIAQVLNIPYAMIDPDASSPDWIDQKDFRDRFDQVKNAWFKEHRNSVGTSLVERREAFCEWVKEQTGRDFAADNWRNWTAEDFAALEADPTEREFERAME